MLLLHHSELVADKPNFLKLPMEDSESLLNTTEIILQKVLVMLFGKELLYELLDWISPQSDFSLKFKCLFLGYSSTAYDFV